MPSPPRYRLLQTLRIFSPFTTPRNNGFVPNFRSLQRVLYIIYLNIMYCSPEMVMWTSPGRRSILRYDDGHCKPSRTHRATKSSKIINNVLFPAPVQHWWRCREKDFRQFSDLRFRYGNLPSIIVLVDRRDWNSSIFKLNIWTHDVRFRFFIFSGWPDLRRANFLRVVFYTRKSKVHIRKAIIFQHGHFKWTKHNIFVTDSTFNRFLHSPPPADSSISESFYIVESVWKCNFW